MSLLDRLRRRASGGKAKKWVYINSREAYDMLCSTGYVRLDKCPEVLTAVRKIADLISSMTIYLMANTDRGDERIKNELSRKIDINPMSSMTRKTWMDTIVMNLFIHGDGNSIVLPTTRNGLLENLIPIDPDRVRFDYDPLSEMQYKVLIDEVAVRPDNLCHFVLNPDPHHPWRGRGITTTIRDVANNLKQASETEKGFMESKWKPSLIVMVDALADEFASPEGRSNLLKSYIQTEEIGQPWVIPSEEMKVEQVKPLTLKDLAIDTTVELNKRTVASIIGVPAFVLGVGSFNQDEWNNFINGTIRPIAQGIEQELTKKLLLNPNWYIKFNMNTLYEYDIQTIASVYADLFTKGIVTGNEVRDKVNLSPKEGLDELILLENYIKLDDISKQGKLTGGNDNEQ